MDGQQWTVTDELLAIVAERVDAWGLFNARAHTEKKHQKQLPKQSLRIPRPGERQQQSTEKRDRVITDSREIAAFFNT